MFAEAVKLGNCQADSCSCLSERPRAQPAHLSASHLMRYDARSSRGCMPISDIIPAVPNAAANVQHGGKQDTSLVPLPDAQVQAHASNNNARCGRLQRSRLCANAKHGHA
jgi:hypothetical protein